MNRTKRFRQKISNKIQFKQNLNNFKVNNSDPNVGIDRNFALGKRNRMVISRSLEEYQSGYMSKSRIVQVSLVKLMNAMTCFRFLVSPIFNQKSVTVLLSDANYLIGNQRLASLALSLSALTILAINLLIFYHEYRHILIPFEFYLNMKQNKLIPLSPRNRRRLGLRINLMVKYLNQYMFWILVVSITTILNSFSYVAYSDPNSGFSLISVIFWSIITVFFAIEAFGTTQIGLPAVAIVVLYLKYKFKEIHQMIQLSLKLNSRTLLMKALFQHHIIAKETKRLNQFFSILVFLLYFLATFPLMILLKLIFNKDTNPYMRPVAVFVFLVEYFVVFVLNLLSSLISQSAQKPRSLLFKALITERLSIRQRFRIMDFIEDLDESNIGFTCWTLFSMNHYNFYRYVANCACTYFLVVGIINHSN